MAIQKTGKKVSARVTQRRPPADTAGAKGTRCNQLTLRASATDVVLDFGLSERAGAGKGTARQSQSLHKVSLSPAMARRVKDALVAFFKKQDTPRARVTAKVAPPKKLH